MDRTKIFETFYLLDKTSRDLAEAKQELFDELARSEKEDAKKDRAFTLVQTIKANVNNDKLTDAEFRDFIRNSTRGT